MQNCSFCLTNFLKPKDIEFTFIYAKEKLEILTFEKLEQESVIYFLLESDLKLYIGNRAGYILKIFYLSDPISILKILRWSLHIFPVNVHIH